MFLTILCSQVVSAAGMTAVQESTGYCNQRKQSNAICYEWALAYDPTVRFIAYGYEDGIEYGFYRVSRDDRYTHTVRIHPVLKDAATTEVLYWGYPWDITDIVLVANDNREKLLVAFEHSIVEDGEVYSPKWQRRVPAVLFVGQTTQPNMKVPDVAFGPLDLDAMRSTAGSPQSSTSSVRGDFDGDGRTDSAMLRSEKHRVILSISRGGHDPAQPQLFSFAIGPAIQAAICQGPGELKLAPQECAPMDEALPGCRVSPKSISLVLSGGECDSINLYWNHEAGAMDWWRA